MLRRHNCARVNIVVTRGRKQKDFMKLQSMDQDIYTFVTVFLFMAANIRSSRHINTLSTHHSKTFALEHISHTAARFAVW